MIYDSGLRSGLNVDSNATDAFAKFDMSVVLVIFDLLKFYKKWRNAAYRS